MSTVYWLLEERQGEWVLTDTATTRDRDRARTVVGPFASAAEAQHAYVVMAREAPQRRFIRRLTKPAARRPG
jgi:hypothetical protein